MADDLNEGSLSRTFSQIKKLNEELKKYREESKKLVEDSNDWIANENAIVKTWNALQGLNRELKVEMRSLTSEVLTEFDGKINKVFTTAISLGKQLSKVMSDATQSNTAYFQSLNQIAGINGELGQLGNTLRNLSGGVVGKSDLSEFFGSTSGIIRGAQAMKEQAGYARNLIAAYGSASTAAQKYQNILLLSEDSQRAMVSLTEKQAHIVEQSASGQLITLKTQLKESMDTLGSSLLYTLKPVIEFASQIVQAFKDVSGVSALDDQTAALAKNLNLTEEEKKAAEELNEIERLRAQGFTSSLDEVHEIGAAYVNAKEEAAEEAEATVQGQEDIQDSMSKTSEKAREIAGSIYDMIQVILGLGSLVGSIFKDLMPTLSQFLSGVLKIVSAFLSWANESGALKGILIGLVSVLGAVKAAQLAYAGAVAAARIAESGLGGVAVASAIVAGLGIAATAGLTMAAGSSSTPVSQPENNYEGTQAQQPQVNIYMDGKKVNDALASERRLNTEVVIR